MRRLLPVLHLRDVKLALAQVGVAVDNGADGVWLIHHADSADVTLKIFERVRHQNPDLWIGVNLLDVSAHVAMRLVTTVSSRGQRIDGLWADDSGITDRGPSHKTREVWAAKEDTGWPGEYFGSVAFKAGPAVQDPARAAAAAMRHMDVVTTSGPTTGVAADIDKIRAMREAIGDHRLGVASGITPDNAQDYVPYVDDFLVATGISLDFHTLDGAKVRALADVVHEG